MTDRFTVELLVAALLVTSFTCIGLLAMWAATSSRHWFIRAAVVLTTLAPLVLVPAYEPLVAFALQCIVVAAGVVAFRRLVARRGQAQLQEGTSAPRMAGLRFSLSSLLLVMVLAAIAFPVMAHLPKLNFYAWSSAAVVGVLSGFAALIAGWMFTSSRKWLIWPIGLILSIGLGAALCGLDWFAYSLAKQGGWPPTGPVPPLYGFTTIPDPPVLTWLGILPATVLLLLALLLLCSTAIVKATAPQHNNRGPSRFCYFARAALAVLFLLLVAFPLAVFWQLLHPTPVPTQKLPSPNGYDDFVAAGRSILGGSPMLNTVVDPKSTDELAAEVAKFAPVYQRIRLGLSRKSEVPLWPIDKRGPIWSTTFPDIQTSRAVSRALSREAELAQQQSRFRDAALISIDNIRAGHASMRGGLLIHHLVGVAMQGVGYGTLYPAIPHLEADACREIVAELEQLERERELPDAVFQRDRIFEENAMGWYGHLMVLLNDIGGTYQGGRSATRFASLRSSTAARLLTMEIALRRYHVENNLFPSELAALVPKYASVVPIDPFDASGRPLRYTRTSDGYLLYSVGSDGDDDGGRPSTMDSGWLGDGDFRLDFYILPDDTPPTARQDDEAANDADASDTVEPDPGDD